MEKTGRKIICGAPTTLVVKGVMMMMMKLFFGSCRLCWQKLCCALHGVSLCINIWGNQFCVQCALDQEHLFYLTAFHTEVGQMHDIELGKMHFIIIILAFIVVKLDTVHTCQLVDHIKKIFFLDFCVFQVE